MVTSICLHSGPSNFSKLDFFEDSVLCLFHVIGYDYLCQQAISRFRCHNHVLSGNVHFDHCCSWKFCCISNILLVEESSGPGLYFLDTLGKMLICFLLFDRHDIFLFYCARNIFLIYHYLDWIYHTCKMGWKSKISSESHAWDKFTVAQQIISF